MFTISWSVCHWQAFPAKSNVCGKARTYPSETPSLALPTNIRLVRKGLPRRNSFITLSPRPNVAKLFTDVIYECSY